MQTSKSNRGFDCVEMKNAIQAKIYAETKDMTFEQRQARRQARLANNVFWQRIKHQTKQKAEMELV